MTSLSDTTDKPVASGDGVFVKSNSLTPNGSVHRSIQLLELGFLGDSGLSKAVLGIRDSSQHSS